MAWLVHELRPCSNVTESTCHHGCYHGGQSRHVHCSDSFISHVNLRNLKGSNFKKIVIYFLKIV
jgi:hypothetical protein